MTGVDLEPESPLIVELCSSLFSTDCPSWIVSGSPVALTTVVESC